MDDLNFKKLKVLQLNRIFVETHPLKIVAGLFYIQILEWLSPTLYVAGRAPFSFVSAGYRQKPDGGLRASQVGRCVFVSNDVLVVALNPP